MWLTSTFTCQSVSPTLMCKTVCRFAAHWVRECGKDRSGGRSLGRKVVRQSGTGSQVASVAEPIMSSRTTSIRTSLRARANCASAYIRHHPTVISKLRRWNSTHRTRVRPPGLWRWLADALEASAVVVAAARCGHNSPINTWKSTEKSDVKPAAEDVCRTVQVFRPVTKYEPKQSSILQFVYVFFLFDFFALLTNCIEIRLISTLHWSMSPTYTWPGFCCSVLLSTRAHRHYLISDAVKTYQPIEAGNTLA